MSQSASAMMQAGYLAAERIIEDFLAESKHNPEEALWIAIDAVKTAASVENGSNTFLLERIIRLASLAVEQS